MSPASYPISIPREIHARLRDMAPMDRNGRKTISGMIRSVLEDRFAVPSSEPLPIAETIDQKGAGKVRASFFLRPAFMKTIIRECERQHAHMPRDKRQSVTNRVIVALLEQAVTSRAKTA